MAELMVSDYPMTSALSMENDIFKSRSKLVLSVFTVLGIGEVTVGIVYLILLFAFKSSVQNHINHLQWVWRLLFGIGLIPLICSLYSRLTMRESKAYEKCMNDCILYHSADIERCCDRDQPVRSIEARRCRTVSRFSRILLQLAS